MKQETGFLEERTRAEDIILGGLGFSGEAKITEINLIKDGDMLTGFKGTAVWLDGGEFEFESEDEPSELEIWALTIISKS